MYANECQTKPATPIGSVTSAVADVSCTASRILKAVERLAERLTPVLRPQGLNDGPACDSPDYNAPLAQEIQSHDRQLIRAEDWLRELEARLEL